MVIVAGVLVAVLRRGGEMAEFPADCPPLDLGEVSAADVALLRPPMTLWGYHVQATEDALAAIARSVTARDVEIATLRRELAQLRGEPAVEHADLGPLHGELGQVPDAATVMTEPDDRAG